MQDCCDFSFISHYFLVVVKFICENCKGVNIVLRGSGVWAASMVVVSEGMVTADKVARMRNMWTGV